MGVLRFQAMTPHEQTEVYIVIAYRELCERIGFAPTKLWVADHWYALIGKVVTAQMGGIPARQFETVRVGRTLVFPR